MNVLDIIALVPTVYFLVSGFKKGLIKEVFGLAALILALLFTLKFSHYFLEKVAEATVQQSAWLPFLVYALLFALSYLAVYSFGNLIEKLMKITQLNFVNRLAGAGLGLLKSLLIVSFIVWLADNARLFTDTVKEESFAYIYVKPVLPWLTENLGKIVPYLEGLKEQIEEYFNLIQQNLDSAN